ncbi:MAG: hypothetical protein E2O39_07670 [Planctomycetota bacterium]|nr:MAG: hypothetical protein E2O39_07670 [Planctomycetota bacterium]
MEGCEDSGARRVAIVATSVAAALVLRLVFFQGVWGSDDLHHLRYALEWDRLPANQWEARLLFNGSLWLSIRAFGTGEMAYALPSLMGSLLAVGSTAWCAMHFGGRRAGLFSGLIAASLPIDVLHATVPVAMPCAAGLAAFGTAVWATARSRFAFAATCAAFALAGLVHWAVWFYVAALCAGSFCSASSAWERWRAIRVGLGSCAVFVVLELGLFWAIAGDPLYELHVIGSQHVTPTLANQDPRTWIWLLEPLGLALFSKDFGPLLAIAAVAGFVARRRLHEALRGFSLAIPFLWFWIGYGTQWPTVYLPLKLMRFAHPAILPLSVLVGVLLARTNRGGSWATAAIAATSVALVASSGSWGQHVEITKAFLPYVQSHPQTRFLADRQSLLEVFVLSGGDGLDNLSWWDDPPPADGAALALLDNSLSRESWDARWLAGETLFTTDPEYRLIGRLLPEAWGRYSEWFVRRPEARIVRVDQRADAPPR